MMVRINTLYDDTIDLVSSSGECREQMMQYMDCLRKNSSTSTPCRVMSKEYLDCRMTKCAYVYLYTNDSPVLQRAYGAG